MNIILLVLVFILYFIIKYFQNNIKKFYIENIELYIFNWKKVNNNSYKLYQEAIKYFKNVTIINCDENYQYDKDTKCINLNDNFYYGGQYQTAISNVKCNNIFGIIVGDTININFQKLQQKLLLAFNTYNVGIYTINDLRSNHTKIIKNFSQKNNFKIVENTDCGIWFIHPDIVKNLKHINYNELSPYGWGIDIITIKESYKLNKYPIRDYSLTCSQIDCKTNYHIDKAKEGMYSLINYYNLN